MSKHQPLEAGPLTRRVTIQSASDTRDAGGGLTRAWTSGETVWANIAAATGRETFRAQQLQADIELVITIRYRTGVTASGNRLLYGSRILKILSVIDPDERHERLVLLCAEEK